MTTERDNTSFEPPHTASPPDTGIEDNLADKAKKLGIPVWKFGGSARERRSDLRILLAHRDGQPI